MTNQPDYQHDTEFTKLLARQSDIDLTLAALEIARDAYPGLDFRVPLDWIAARAEELSGPVARARSEADALRELGRCLAKTHGLRGQSDAYENADASCLHRVIETGSGLPITLSILYMAVAQRVRIELCGVSAPRHFFMRYESAAGPLFIDAFSDGRVLDEEACARWVRELSGDPDCDIEKALEPASPRAIILRMLNNLKSLYARREEWRAAWRVQHRLAALCPVSYQERRDLAIISLRAHRPGQAVDLLESCLRACPPDEKPTLRAHLDDAGKQLARWN